MLSAMLVAAATAASAPSEAYPWPAAKPIAEAAKGALRAAGAEPFWGLEINGKTVKLTQPADDGEKIDEFQVVSSSAMGETTHVWTAGALTVTYSAEACSDGMSDAAYPYTVEAVLVGEGGATFKGCGYRPWGQDILTALPIIDACMKSDSAEAHAILYAAASAPDTGFLLMPAGDGDTHACTVKGGEVTAGSHVGDATPAGTGAEMFIRGPGENPGGECYEASEVKDADGNVVGWWFDPEGC